MRVRGRKEMRQLWCGCGVSFFGCPTTSYLYDPNRPLLQMFFFLSMGRASASTASRSREGVG